MIPEPEELVRKLFVSVDPPVTSSGYAVVPYTNALTEPLTQVLRKYIINKPIRKLQQNFSSLKDGSMRLMQTNVVYKINCKDCMFVELYR